MRRRGEVSASLIFFCCLHARERSIKKNFFGSIGSYLVAVISAQKLGNKPGDRVRIEGPLSLA